MNKDKFETFEDFVVSIWEEEQKQYIEVKLGAFSVIIICFDINYDLYKMVIDNAYTLSDMQDSVVVFKWLKSFWHDLANKFIVRLIANEAEDDSIMNYEEVIEIINGSISTIKAKCDYYNAVIDSQGNWVFEIDDVRIEKQSNITRLNDFQGFDAHAMVPKEYKAAMKIIITRMLKDYAKIQEIIAS